MEKKNLRREIFIVLLVVWSILVFISLISYSPGDPSFFTVSSTARVKNYAGLIGSYLSDLLFQLFGLGAWFFVLIPIYITFVLFSDGGNDRWRVYLGTFSLFLIIPALLHLFLPPTVTSAYYPGGMIGKLIGDFLERLFGRVGVFIVLIGALVIALIYSTGISFFGLLKGLLGKMIDFFRYSETIEEEKDLEEEDEIEFTRKTIEMTGELESTMNQDGGESFESIPDEGRLEGSDDKPFVLGDDDALSEPSTEFTLGIEEDSPGTVADGGSVIDDVTMEEVAPPVEDPMVVPAEEETVKEPDEADPIPPSLDESGEIEIYEVEEKESPGMKKRGRKSLFPGIKEYRMPDISFLQKSPVENIRIDESTLKEKARVLKNKLAEFKVEGKVVGILPGPIITRFEFVPAPGIKVSQVVNLADDLSMALRAKKVRISVISERGVIGIEVPNENRRVVRLREIIESEQYQNPKLRLPLILGLDIAGIPVVEDLSDMPHLLIAGTTGSGKSVGINSILVGLLYRHTPQTLRLVLVDPKLVELSIYADIPHLLVPVISESERAVGVLRGIVDEMERRYYMLRLLKVRNIEEYNKKFEQLAKGAREVWIEGERELLPRPDVEVDSEGKVKIERLPYIVVVIDEYSDLMFATGKKVEEFVARLAQKARAAGIHLILATQRPSAKVVTGIIKSNLPARIAYNVRSATDSRIILDDPGASQLLGKGDMLFLHPSKNELRRIQGPLVTLEEVKLVVDFWKQQGRPVYREDLIKVEGENDPSQGENNDDRFRDELYFKAVRIAMEEGEISASRLQRRLGIGYNRAARYVEMMEREGLISRADGARPRKVLKYIDVDELEGRR